MQSGSSSRTRRRAEESSRSSSNVESFMSFFETWLVRQEHYLDELSSVAAHCQESREEDLKELISRILAHYEQYYEEKSRIAQHNIFLVFSPPWFSSLERTYFWVAGFKPELAFRVLNTCVDDLSEEQKLRMATLRHQTKANERNLNDELAKIQESVASPPFTDLIRRDGRVVGGEGGERVVLGDQSAVEMMGSEMEEVVAKADLLRTNTVVKVVEILNSVQTVKFLLAVTQLQLKVRNIGFSLEKNSS